MHQSDNVATGSGSFPAQTERWIDHRVKEKDGDDKQLWVTCMKTLPGELEALEVQEQTGEQDYMEPPCPLTHPAAKTEAKQVCLGAGMGASPAQEQAGVSKVDDGAARLARELAAAEDRSTGAALARELDAARLRAL